MSSQIHLVAQGAKATILPQRGGLLSSLQLMVQDEARELLWLPTDFAPTGSGWPGGGMPIMFPFAGRVFLGGEPFRYAMDGASYGMPLHGFAYGLPWRVEEQTAASCTLVCTHGPGTTPLYPYEFSVTARFSLAATRLTVQLDVEHVKPLSGAPAAMPVALGWHPYWRIDEASGELATRARQEIQVTPAGAAGKGHPVSSWSSKLTEPKARNLILGDLAGGTATLKDKNVELGLAMTPESLWQNWVLWSKGEGFHCVEPWMGLPDAVSTGAGLQRLAAGDRLSATFAVTVR